MRTIYNDADIHIALEYAAGHDILAFDIETTGLNPRQDRIMGFGFSGPLDGIYISLARWVPGLEHIVDTDISRDSVVALLQVLAKKKLIMWNGTFDTTFVLNSLGVDLLPALYCDGMLLKHTCDEDFPFGLKEVATKLFGTSAKKEKEEMQASIKANNGTATEYYKADSDLLGRYCIQDCLLTWKIYSYYSKDLVNQGLEHFFYNAEVMPLYREVTIPMERTGVCVDVPALKQAKADIVKDIAAIETEIQSAIEPHLSIFTAWFLNKEYPATTPSGKPSAWTKLYPSALAAWRADNPTGHMFNLQSKHHLKKLFFDTLREQPLSRTPTGQPQVNEEFLDAMAAKYPWAAQLVVYNKLNKLLGTYISRFITEQENGIFYPSFFQYRTVSGRYAGDFQQMPRPISVDGNHPLVAHYTNLIRSFIIPRPGNLLMAADYNQLEPSIFAHTSGDSRLQKIFIDNLDFYSEIAIRTERLQDVSSSKRDPAYLGAIAPAVRQKAKAYALGIAYGMTGYKLQFEIGVSEHEANALVNEYLGAFPDLAAWMQHSRDTVRTTGCIATQSGRIRHMPQVRELYERYGSCIDNDLELWKAFKDMPALYAQAKADRKTYKNLLNNAINFQVQGLAASIVNRAAIAIVRELKSKGLRAQIVGQVHDELVLDVPENELTTVSEIVIRCMTCTTVISVPLTVQPKSANNYKECK